MLGYASAATTLCTYANVVEGELGELGELDAVSDREIESARG